MWFFNSTKKVSKKKTRSIWEYYIYILRYVMIWGDLSIRGDYTYCIRMFKSPKSLKQKNMTKLIKLNKKPKNLILNLNITLLILNYSQNLRNLISEIIIYGVL